MTKSQSKTKENNMLTLFSRNKYNNHFQCYMLIETTVTHNREIGQYTTINQMNHLSPLHTLIDSCVLPNFPVTAVVSIGK